MPRNEKPSYRQVKIQCEVCLGDRAIKQVNAINGSEIWCLCPACGGLGWMWDTPAPAHIIEDIVTKKRKDKDREGMTR